LRPSGWLSDLSREEIRSRVDDHRAASSGGDDDHRQEGKSLETLEKSSCLSAGRRWSSLHIPLENIQALEDVDRIPSTGLSLSRSSTSFFVSFFRF